MNQPSITETFYLFLDELLMLPINDGNASVNDALRDYVHEAWRRNALAGGKDLEYVDSYKFAHVQVDPTGNREIEIKARFLREDAWKDVARHYGKDLKDRLGVKISPRRIDDFYHLSIAAYHPAGRWELMPVEDREEATRLFFAIWDEGDSRKEGTCTE